MPHLTRKEIKKPDWFIRTIGKVRTGFSSRKKEMILVLGVLAAALGGGGFYQNHKNHDDREATTLFAKSYQQLELAERAMERGTEEEKIKDHGENVPSDAMVSIDPGAFYQEAQKGLEEILAKHPHSKVTPQAALYLGIVHFKQNHFEKSVEAYEQTEKLASRDKLIRLEAHLGKAKSLEADGKIPEAIATFEFIRQSDAAWLKSIAVENLFRLYLQSGETEKADQLSQEIAKNPNETALANSLKGIRKLYEKSS